MSDIDGLDVAILAATSGFASESHTHPELSGLTSSTITKDTGTFTNLVVTNASLDATSITASGLEVNGGIQASTVSASAATFQTLTVTGEVTMSLSSVDFQNINASSLTVNGSAVSLEGHGHSTADIDGLESRLSTFASSGHTHSEYASVGHTHSEITPIEFMTASAYSALASKDSGTIYFVDDNSIYKGSELYGAATFDQLNFSVIEATSLTVQGSAVALDGHTHSMADVSGLETTLSGFASTGHTHSNYASMGHTHSELSGITATSITKETGTFTNLVVANASITATSIIASGA